MVRSGLHLHLQLTIKLRDAEHPEAGQPQHPRRHVLLTPRCCTGSGERSILTPGASVSVLLAEHRQCSASPGSYAKLKIVSRRASPRGMSKSPEPGDATVAIVEECVGAVPDAFHR